MNRRLAKYSLLVALAATAGTGALAAQGQVKLDPVAKDGSAVTGYYVPQRLILSSTAPKSIKKAPAAKSPAYGILPVKSDGGRTFHVILDENASSGPALYVDANGDGDLTNDPAVAWKAYKASNGYSTWEGYASLKLSSGSDALDAQFGIYRFDPKDPSRENLRDSLIYYADYAYAGKASIGGTSYDVALADDGASGDFSAKGTKLLVDRDGDGTFDGKWEIFAATEPFNIDGTTWELAGLRALGGSFAVKKSSATVAELKPPADLSVGKQAIPFTATDMSGKQVSFPKDFAGKIVLLDFWATWCGPCVGEVPGLAAAYKKYSPKGFDVLGVTLDDGGAEKDLRAFMKKNSMVWREIYDGKGWAAQIGQLYFIESIPSSFLVDGDTGVILAKTDSLRGSSLVPTLEAALKKKGKL
jgi:thiol-disulfide isomerase/thioredoxin